MQRIIAVSLTALLLTLSGIWLARHPNPVAAQAESGAAANPALPQDLPADLPTDLTPLPYLSEDRQLSFEAPGEVLDSDLDYLALLETSKGDMLIDLLESAVPETVNNFVFLALNHYYDGVVFHRVLEDFMAQTGDPTGTGRGGPGYTFPDEIDPNLKHDAKGVVSMANAGPDTNGSQFFITFVPTPWLDGRHTIFGRLLEGPEVLDALQRIDPSNPDAVARLTDTLATLTAQGIELNGTAERTVREQLQEALGAIPVSGQTFQLEGYTGVMGRIGGDPAVGFFPKPDFIERVIILTRAAPSTP